MKVRGSFRAICLYRIEPKTHKKQRHSKHFLNVLLLDPYHLFIPSSFNGLTSDEYLEQTYDKVGHFTESLSDVVNFE